MGGAARRKPAWHDALEFPDAFRPSSASRPSRCGTTMKTVAVLGGGPAGAFAAAGLAKAGLKVVLFDEKLAWEKPCGGGLTYKAYQQYPFLIENDWPKKLVRQTVLGAPRAGEATMDL